MVLSQNWNNPRFKERKKNPTKNPHKICAESKYVFSASSYRQKGNTILISIGHHHFSSCMFCLIYYFLPIFLKISLGPSLKHFPSVFHFLQDEVSVSYPLRGGGGGGGRKKKKLKETCKWVKEGYYLATWFDSIYTLEFWVTQYPMTASSLLCLTGTCPVHYRNVCCYCWSTHWGTHVPFALRKRTPFPSPAGPFLTCFHQSQTFLCLPHLLVSYHRSGERDHLGGLLQPAQSRINTEFRPRCSGLYLLRCWKSVGMDFSQPLGNLLQSPWFDSTQFLLRFWPTHSSC